MLVQPDCLKIERSFAPVTESQFGMKVTNQSLEVLDKRNQIPHRVPVSLSNFFMLNYFYLGLRRLTANMVRVVVLLLVVGTILKILLLLESNIF